MSRISPQFFRGPCNFYRDVFGGWRWEFEDARGEMRDSQYSFETLKACVAAAASVGLHPQETMAARAYAQPGELEKVA